MATDLSKGYGLSKWDKAQPIYDELNNLTSQPIYCVSDEALKYFLPLIQGEVDIFMRNGMPLHFMLK